MTNANKFNLLLDVVKLMHSLADGLEAVAYAFADSQEIFVEAKEVSKPVETGQPTKQIAAEKAPSLADVRAVLAVKTQNGMTAEVKGLITKYGGTKLSDVDPKHYADLIKDAEVLGKGNHALLSPSSSHRWLSCTPSAVLETEFENKSSNAAEEGTAFHALCEHKLKKALRRRSKRPVSSFNTDEMEEHSDGYVEFVLEQLEKAKQTCPDPLC